MVSVARGRIPRDIVCVEAESLECIPGLCAVAAM